MRQSWCILWLLAALMCGSLDSWMASDPEGDLKTALCWDWWKNSGVWGISMEYQAVFFSGAAVCSISTLRWSCWSASSYSRRKVWMRAVGSKFLIWPLVGRFEVVVGAVSWKVFMVVRDIVIPGLNKHHLDPFGPTRRGKLYHNQISLQWEPQNAVPSCVCDEISQLPEKQNKSVKRQSTTSTVFYKAHRSSSFLPDISQQSSMSLRIATLIDFILKVLQAAGALFGAVREEAA